jgi:hypothetical protein
MIIILLLQTNQSHKRMLCILLLALTYLLLLCLLCFYGQSIKPKGRKYNILNRSNWLFMTSLLKLKDLHLKIIKNNCNNLSMSTIK